ncbi:MAG: hypothetical protein JSS14_22010 [Proteobacteria bacterium]|nr:hypothetical protein [Pseudomonadota bacterium]
MSNDRTFSVSHFDLLDYVRTFPQADIAAEMAQGLAFRIDVGIQQASREIFKAVRQDLFDKGVDGLSELTIALRESDFAGQSFADCGIDTTNWVQQIGDLWTFREAAHNMAAELAPLTLDFRGQPLKYMIPDIEDVFMGEVKLKLNNDTRRRLVKNVERRAKALDMDEDIVKQVVAKKLERKEDRLKDIGITLEEQASAVYELFRQALLKSPHTAGDDFRFYQLDMQVQRTLIEQATTNAGRAEERAEDNRFISDAQADEISMFAIKAEKELKSVLKSDRFVTAARIAEAGTI